VKSLEYIWFFGIHMSLLVTPNVCFCHLKKIKIEEKKFCVKCIERYISFIFHDFSGGWNPTHPKNFQKLEKVSFLWNAYKVILFDFSCFWGVRPPTQPPKFSKIGKSKFFVKCIESYIFWFSMIFGGSDPPTPSPKFSKIWKNQFFVKFLQSYVFFNFS